jgi:hypothetical protein
MRAHRSSLNLPQGDQMKKLFATLIDCSSLSVKGVPQPTSLRKNVWRLFLFSCAWLMLLPTTMQAQQESPIRVRSATAPGTSNSFTKESDKSVLPSRRYNLFFDPSSIAYRLKDLGPEEMSGLAPNQVGIRRAVVLQPDVAGISFTNQDGTAVRVLAITSPGASGLRLHFEKFALSENDEVYVYGTVDDYVGGPYSGSGPQASGDFWSPTVNGETVVIEYHTKSDSIPFDISELSHIFAGDKLGNTPGPAPAPILACEHDASCFSEVERSAVARMLFVENGGSFVCTGTLMNTTNGSFIPYFLTAHHCISTQASANTLETYWFYQTTSCNSGILRSDIVHLASGAKLLSTSQSADETLLQLFDNAPAGTWFSGWDSAASPLNQFVFDFHHPGGGTPPSTDSYLRAADGNITNTSTSCSAAGLSDGYTVAWSDGVTEPGSSGSGLWYSNGANNFLIGTLSCGPSNPDCVNTTGLFGKFSDFFPLISNYLAPPQSPTGLQYFPLAAPVRLLDTRSGQTACDAPGAALSAGVARTEAARIACTGIPATAQAIVGNATVVNTTGAGAGFVTLYPSNAARPNVSNLNYVPGQIVPNAFTVGLGSDGAFEIYAQTGVHFIVDVTGYYAPPTTGGLYFHPLPSPIRLLDTRAGQSACQAPGTPLAGGSVRTQAARLTCGGITIPSTAQAVVGNATLVNPSNGGSGFVTLYPSNAARPNVSNLNYVPGNTVPNAFVVGLGSDGAFNIYALTTLDFIVDISGYFSNQQTDANGTGLLYTPLPAPFRLLDTRAGQSACDAPGVPLTAGNARNEVARITCNNITVPATAQAVVGNATVVNTTGAGAGFITLYPSNATRPNVSNLNYVTGQVVPNAFTVGLGSDGAFKIYPFTGVHFITDITGYYAP